MIILTLSNVSKLSLDLVSWNSGNSGSLEALDKSTGTGVKVKHMYKLVRFISQPINR